MKVPLIFDGQRTVTVPRERVALKKDAVPTIFHNCPSYLSDWNSRPKRLSKDDKEQLMIQAAYSQSLTANEETVDKFLVNSYSDLLSKINLIDLRNGWISHISENNPLFFMKIVISESGPIIERSVSVDNDLFIKAFDNKNLSILLSRISIDDTRQIESLLDEVDKFSPIIETVSSSTELSINNLINIAIRQLESAIGLLEGDSLDLDNDDSSNSESLKLSLHFFIGQLTNLTNSKNNRRYNILTQVFSLKIYGIAPACYRFIHASNCLALPHERKLLAIKNTLGIGGEYFQILKEITSKFSPRERHVILQMGSPYPQ